MPRNLLFLLLLSVPQFTEQGYAQIVDLTNNQNQTSLGLPGMSSSGSPNGNSKDGETKLGLTISHIRATCSPDGRLRLEILIHNNGNQSFHLPTSQDQRKVHKAGSTNRKEFVFSIVKQKGDAPPHVASRKAMSVFFSSDNFSQSYLTLAAGASVRVAVSAPAQSVNLHIGDEIFVFAEESDFSDNQFMIISHTEPVRSEEAATVVERN